MVQTKKSDKKTWRLFMMNISFIIALYLMGIFLGFVLRTNHIIKEHVRGGISVSFDISKIQAQMKINKIFIGLISIASILLLISIVFFMVSRLSKKLTAAYKKISLMAIIDELTQLYNRRHFHVCLDQELNRSKRYGNLISLLMLDIDYFKKVNDTYGHQAGDTVLAGVSKIVKSITRTTDIVARYGGEEIVIILPQTSLQGAVKCAEKIRQSIGQKEFKEGNDQTLSVTVSIGVSSLTRIEKLIKDEAKHIIKMADEALYTAKASGRNQVVKKEIGS